MHCAGTREAKVIAIGTKKAPPDAGVSFKLNFPEAVQRAKMLIPSILQNQEKASGLVVSDALMAYLTRAARSHEVKCFEEAQQTRLKALLNRQARIFPENAGVCPVYPVSVSC